MPSVCASMPCTGGVRHSVTTSAAIATAPMAAERVRGTYGSAARECAQPVQDEFGPRRGLSAGLRWWPARCGGSRPTAHNQTNTITMGVQHARSSAESFALCKTPRAVKPRRGHKTWQRRGVASFLERALMQVPAATRARVRPMTDLRLWRQIVPGGNLALRQRRCQGKQHPTLALAEAQGNGGRHDEIRRRQAGRRDAGEQRCRLDAHA